MATDMASPRQGNRPHGSQIVMDGDMGSLFGRAARQIHLKAKVLKSLRMQRTEELLRKAPILVTLTRLDGEPLLTKTISGSTQLERLAKAAAKKLGGRNVELFMKGERLDQELSAIECGLADGCNLMATLSNAVLRIFANDNAFCGLQADGGVIAWGHEERGGVLGTSAAYLSEGVKQIFACGDAFFAEKDDGKLVSWGSSTNVFLEVPDGSVLQIVPDPDGFACLTAKGDVLDVGKKVLAKRHIVPHRHAASLYRTDHALAALTSDGGVVVWGDSGLAGDVKKQLRTGVRRLVAGSDAFAAFKVDRSVVAWGNLGDNFLPWKLSGGVKEVFAAGTAFVAVKTDGSVVMWGTCKCLPDTKSRPSKAASWAARTHRHALPHVLQIPSQKSGSAAAEPCHWCTNRSDVELQISESGGLVQLVAAKRAFAGLCSNGSVITWGDPKLGGKCCATHNSTEDLYSVTGGHLSDDDESSEAGKQRGSLQRPSLLECRDVSLDLSTQVVHVVASDLAFAALRKGGDVVSWGDDRHGGSTARVQHLLDSNVKEIVANAFAFAALLTDGSVVTWGHPKSGGSPGKEITDKLVLGVVQVASTRSAFTALKNDGTIVTWGHARYGGDSRGVRRLIEEEACSSASSGDDSSSIADDSAEARGERQSTLEPRQKPIGSSFLFHFTEFRKRTRKVVAAGVPADYRREVRSSAVSFQKQKRKAMLSGNIHVDELKVPAGMISRVYGVIEEYSELGGKTKTKSEEKARSVLPNIVLKEMGKTVTSQFKVVDSGDPPRMVNLLPSCRPLRRAAPSHSGSSRRQPDDQSWSPSAASGRRGLNIVSSDVAEADSIMARMAMARQEARSCQRSLPPQPVQTSRQCTLSPHLFSPHLDRADTEDWPIGTALALQLDNELPELPGQPRDGQTHTGAVHWLTEVLPEVSPKAVWSCNYGGSKAPALRSRNSLAITWR